MGKNDIIFSIEVQPMSSGGRAIALILRLQLFQTCKPMFVKKKWKYLHFRCDFLVDFGREANLAGFWLPKGFWKGKLGGAKKWLKNAQIFQTQNSYDKHNPQNNPNMLSHTTNLIFFKQNYFNLSYLWNRSSKTLCGNK